MATKTDIRQNMIAGGRTIIDHLYASMTPGTAVEYKTTDLAEATGLAQSFSDDRCVELAALGILTRTVQYGRYNSDGTYKIGRFAMWELKMPKEKALEIFGAWADRLLAGEITAVDTHIKAGRTIKREPVGPVTITDEPTEDTKAIAGPEAPKPLAALAPLRKADDATALIEAARQYAKRTDKVAEQVAALKATASDLGIEIDETAMLLSIHLVPDDRLETVGLVLPAIDRLERENARLITQVADMHDKVKANEQMATDNRRLRARVEALVSERVQTQQRAQA